MAPTEEGFSGYGGRRLLSVLNQSKLKRVLATMLAENEFLGAHGIRSLSKPYLPAESDTGVFGGNSNWRGPIWMPVNVLLIRGLLNLSHQTGWTGLIAPLADLFGRMDAKTLLESDRGRFGARMAREQVGGEPAPRPRK